MLGVGHLIHLPVCLDVLDAAALRYGSSRIEHGCPVGCSPHKDVSSLELDGTM